MSVIATKSSSPVRGSARATACQRWPLPASHLPPFAISGALVDAQETERTRIARELHDGVGQKLALLQIELTHIARTLPSPTHREQLEALSAQAGDIARELHEVSHELHPMKLEILGCAQAIECLCRECARQSGIQIRFSSSGTIPRHLGPRESLCLYRVAQEALHNVIAHSEADSASVHLAGGRGTVRLTVADAGRGFDSALKTSGMGLASMRQRVEVLKGACEVWTAAGRGTRITVQIPV